MKQNDDYQRIPCFLVGIAGGSASGKSTFVKALKAALDAEYPSLRVKLLSTDGYYRRVDNAVPTYYSPTFEMELPDYNHPDALELPKLLTEFREVKDSLGAVDILIIEGHLVFAVPEIRDQLDLRVFIELDADARALRRIERNLARKGDPIPDHSLGSIANYYLESAKEGHRKFIEPSRKYADLIFRGDGDFARNGFQIRGCNPCGANGTSDEAATIIEQEHDGISKRFAKSLREWVNVKAGER